MGKQNRLVIFYNCNTFYSLVLQFRMKERYSKDFLNQANKLNKEAGLLNKAWSQMAIQNLLIDINRTLAQLKKGLPKNDNFKELNQILVKTQERVKNELKLTSTSKYKNILCLGYLVKTSYPKYRGKSDDRKDMETRCEYMKEAIQKAFELAKNEGSYNKDENMLKLFMAPEFFFRGINGAYDFDVVNGKEEQNGKPRKKGILEILGEETKKPKYKDWLFVFGTAICATKVTKSICKVCKGDIISHVNNSTGRTTLSCKNNKLHKGIEEEVKGAMIDNIAFIQKEETQYIVAKELISHIDFIKSPQEKDVVNLRNESLKILLNKQKSKYNSASSIQTNFSDERMGGSVFSIDGIRFGLEVCLDHSATTNNAKVGRLKHASNVQIQLIPSAGMSIESLGTISKGIIFNVDGSDPHIQVVGGGAIQQLHYDQLMEFNSKKEVYMKKHSSNIINWDEGKIISELNKKFKFVYSTNTPKLSCNEGKVLLYGPYEIPEI